MNAEAVKKNERRFFDFVNKKEITALENWIDEFVSDDFTNHNPVLNAASDKNGLKEMFRNLIHLFPGMTITIEEMVFENDILCFRHTIGGMGTDDEVTGLAMVKFKNGKIVDRWATTEAR